MGKHGQTVQILLFALLAAASVSAHGKDPTKELLEAASKGNTSRVKLLLEKGIQVNAVDGKGRTALFRAVEKGHVNTVRVLLEAGADSSIKNNKGRTPWSKIPQKKDREATAIRSLLHIVAAARQGDLEALRLHLKLGRDADLPAEDGVTALYMASQEGHAEIVLVLLENGAAVNLQMRIPGQTGH